MNRTKLKNYAPQARRDFIKAVTDRAAYYGLTANTIEPMAEKGDVAIIGDKAHTRAVAQKRKALEARIGQRGFEQTMEAMAYTWFNRFVAIRFMELHGYLDHGYRVLSHPEGKATPEILEHAEHVDLPGLDKNTIIDLKLDGSKEAELYRLLLIAQCNPLHAAMPFLFEQIDDETELLLPDNLLHSDSLIRKLVNEIDEEDWQEVEIIGWLYQFYISEKKDQVIGKVVKSEDIPAATQLFTPNWIVKYLVQNSLGRQWLATYPESPLRQQMEYYIEPAEQTPEVQAQLKAITPESLNPEELTLLDPACGSGHILVEAYDLFKAIYQERGYRARDIPTLILQKNLFGLEIDDRAAQLAAFALMMKARADDRRIFASRVQPQVLSIQESKGLNAKALTEALNVPLAQGERASEEPEGHVIASPSLPLILSVAERSRRTLRINSAKQSLSEKEIASSLEPALSEAQRSRRAPRNDRSLPISPADITDLINLFEHGKTFGSLIQMPPTLVEKLPAIGHRVRDVLAYGDLMMQPAAKVLLPLIEQAWLLSQQYDAVVANPPYMGSKYFNDRLKNLVSKNYEEGKGDLYACFMLRNIAFAKPSGRVGMITIPNWMFLSSFEELRRTILNHQVFDSFIHNGRGVWGSDFGSCSFTIRNNNLLDYKGVFRKLFDKPGSVGSNEELERRFFSSDDFVVTSLELQAIPGNPIAYWISDPIRALFKQSPTLGKIAPGKVGMRSGDNDQFIRFWYEVAVHKIEFHARSATDARESKKKWFPFKKGGPFRKWYGNNFYLINWESNGEAVKQRTREKYPQLGENLGWKITNEPFYFLPCITWTDVSISMFGVRISDHGFIFSTVESAIFPEQSMMKLVAGFLSTKLVFDWLQLLNPTLHFPVGVLDLLPFNLNILLLSKEQIERVVTEAYVIARMDWDSFETSWDFQTLLVLKQRAATLAQSQAAADAEVLARFQRMKQLEEENNRLFIEAYGLQDELSPKVPEDQITLARPDREEDIKRMISYAIGCMMGRYKPQNTLNTRKEEKENLSCDSCISWSGARFEVDPDGIVPIMDTDWFPDDAVNRFVEFISVAWPKEHLEENLTFVAESLGPNRGEQPRETIRRYLAQSFFKDHLKTYKRRPIYWLFTSGKQRAFQCLVYLHRYHEGTLSRMRTEYVIPLQGKLNARIEQLTSEIQRATSTSHRKKLEKEQDALRKQQAELQAFDEKLRHYADRRISLDLDNGVKVNYGKFGDLLAEVKAVCGEE